MRTYILKLSLILLIALVAVAHASFTTPLNVVKWVNVSLYNHQSPTIAAGTQVLITFNGIAYNSIFDGNAINIEVFNGLTGNVLYSMFMGNQNQANQKAGFNTISNDFLFTVLPVAIPAATNAVNVISIGFFPMGSTALNGNNMGIAPQMNCSSGCPQSYYAQYDNGNNVFSRAPANGNSLYTNFVGCAGTYVCASGSGSAGTANGITFTGSASVTSVDVFNPQNDILEGLGNFIIPNQYQQFGTSNTDAYAIQGCSGEGAACAATGNYNLGLIGQQTLDLKVATGNQEHFMSIWASSTYVTGDLDYTPNVIESAGYVQHTLMPARLTFAASGQVNAFFQYLYIRQVPPNSIQPSIIFGSTQVVSTGTPTISASNTPNVAGGGTEVFTALTGSSLNSPYTFNYYVINSITSNQLAFQSYTSVASTTNTFTWAVPNSAVGNMIIVNVVVTDASLNIANSIYTNTITITPYVNSITLVNVTNSLLGNPLKVFTNVTTIQNVNLTTQVQIGCYTKAQSSVLTNKYYYTTTSFNPNAPYCLVNPASGASITVTVNGIVSYPFLGNTFYANSVATFSDYYPSLAACSASNANAINYQFYWAGQAANVPNSQVFQNGKAPNNGVLLQGYYQLVSGSWNSPPIIGSTAGFSTVAASNTYSTCISPKWAQTNVFASLTYGTTNALNYTYYLLSQPISNVPTNILLYLTPSNVFISQYAISVVNLQTAQLSTAYVQALLLNPNTNVSTVVDEFYTPSGRNATVDIILGQYYRYLVFNSTGTLIGSTGYTQATCAVGLTCTYLIQVNLNNQVGLNQYLGNLNSNCGNVTISNNKGQITCTISTINGTSIYGQLIVTQGGLLITTTICQTNATSASMTLTCTVPNVSTTRYTYCLYAVINGGFGKQQLGSCGDFGNAFGTTLFDPATGWIVTLAFAVVLSMLFLAYPPLAIIGAVMGVIAGAAFGLIILSVASIGAGLFFAALIFYAANRSSEKSGI